MDNTIKLREIGARIKKEREALSMTLEQLAEVLNTTRQSVSKWEKGLGTLDMDSVLRMCDLFECEIGYLTCEYDCKRKETTDVCSVTGLDEKAVEILLEYSSSDYGKSNNYMSKLIQELDFWKMIKCIDKMCASIKKCENTTIGEFTLSALSHAAVDRTTLLLTGPDIVDHYRNNAIFYATKVISDIFEEKANEDSVYYETRNISELFKKQRGLDQNMMADTEMPFEEIEYSSDELSKAEEFQLNLTNWILYGYEGLDFYEEEPNESEDS